MERVLEYHILHSDQGKCIRKFLEEKGYSRQNITDLKKMPQSILVNQKWEHVTYQLQLNDLLVIHIQENASSEKIEPQELALSICYEDEDILVVNKPADMPVHPSLNHYYGTLANAVAYYYGQQNKEYIYRCTNRLDKDTSGLVILAKNMLSASILGKEMKERKIKREYLAIVKDCNLDDKGTIDAPIDRKENSLIERMVSPAGQRAITHFQVVERKKGLALVSLKLDTGRTHQIRVHMKYIGSPLIGDSLYAPEYCFMNRQALHSYRLTFTHPITGENLFFEQEIPEDMRVLLEK